MRKDKHQKSCKENINYKLFLFLVVIFALIIRVIFFVGYIAADDQDEGIYAAKLGEIYLNTFSFKRYKGIDNQYLANPAEIFGFRLGFLLPISAIHQLAGAGETTSMIYPLICSLGGVMLAFIISKELINPRAGLIAAFILASTPLDILFSTRLMPDIVLAFLIGLSVFLFLKAESIRSIKLYFISGAMLALAYMVKPTAIVMIPLLGIFIIKRYNALGVFSLGLVSLLLIESLGFYSQTGVFFLSQKMNRGQILHKYTYEDFTKIPILSLGSFNYVDGSPIFYFTHLLGFGKRYPQVNYFGLVFILIFFSIPFSIFTKWRKKWFIIFWFFALLFYLEFGPAGLRLSKSGGIEWLLIFKRERFATILLLPGVVLAASVLSRIPKLITISILCIILTSSLTLVGQSRGYLRSGIEAVKQAIPVLKRYPSLPIYSNHLTSGNLYFLMGFSSRIKLIDPKNLDHIGPALVVDGGSSGVDVCAEVFQNFSRQIKVSKEWQLIAKIPNPMSADNPAYQDLKIYLTPKS